MLVRFASLFLCATFATAQIGEGDVCQAASDGRPAWLCKVIQDCLPAQKLIKIKKTPPARFRCGFKRSQPMVCCPPYDVPEWGSAAPAIVAAAPTTKLPSVFSFPKNGSSKAARMCREYSNVTLVEESVMSLLESSTKPVKTRKCDRSVTLIVGGEAAAPMEFPHMALLGYGIPPKYHCGGSLISDKFILTAAHCERHPKYGLIQTILLGDLDTSTRTDDAKPQMFNVSRRIVHPKYLSHSKYNDIMLLEMDKKVNFSLYIRPACLQTVKEIAQKNATATGWGRTILEVSSSEEMSPSSPMLQKIEIPFVSSRTCNESFKTHFGTPQLRRGITDDTLLCAGGQENRSACNGDSGGPLQIPLGDCMYSVVGITSFGRMCGLPGSPGVYTRVSAYVSWIEKIVWP